MYDINDFKLPNNYKIINTKKGKEQRQLLNEILCFDIETSTAYYIDGKWQEYTYGIESEKYKDIKSYTWCYIWQFGFNDNVYFGRKLTDFKFFLTRLVLELKCDIVIYIHNAGFEMQFLRNIFSDIKVFARKPRHPMKFSIEISSYIVEFRCSLVLTNSSLEQIGKNNKKYKKMVGDLDYKKIRFSDTELTDKELGYCENDILVMYEYLANQKKIYNNRIDRIPLTQTGKVRKSLQAYYRKAGRYEEYNEYCRKLVPTLEEYEMLKEVFSGGYVHANPLEVDEINENVKSKDLSSAYPARMVAEKYPTSHFIRTNYKTVEDIPDKFLWCARILFIDIESTKCFNYIQRSKIYNCYKVVSENGRVERAKQLEILVTNVDYEIICDCYKWKGKKMVECWTAECGYMDNTYREFILDVYGSKTELKDVKGMEDDYARKKEELNGNFGQAVTNYVVPEVGFEDDWTIDENFNNEKKQAILDRLKESRTLLTIYSHGIYITAYNRKTLFKALCEVNYDGIYSDTDSVKYKGNYDDFFDDFNKDIINQLLESLKGSGIESSKLSPLDKNGNPHMLGIFESEKPYKYFKTLGCKKYAYIYENSADINITVAGVNKETFKKKENEKYNTLKTLDDFTNDLVFDEHCSGRLLATYVDSQEPVEIDGHLLYSPHAISLRPSTYKINLTDKYIEYLAQANAGYYLGKRGTI